MRRVKSGAWTTFPNKTTVSVKSCTETQTEKKRSSSFVVFFLFFPNVAYKYNLLLVLKILSYTFYSSTTGEMQAAAGGPGECWRRKKKRVTFSLYNTVNHEAPCRREEEQMQKVQPRTRVHDCFQKGATVCIDGPNQTTANVITKKKRVDLEHTPTVTAAAGSFTAIANIYIHTYIFEAQTRCRRIQSEWLLSLMNKQRNRTSDECRSSVLETQEVSARDE